jgi:hypothetical protein
VTFADGWTCKACWKSNRPKDQVCYRCKTPRDADDATVEATRAAAEARAERPEAVPDAPGVFNPTAVRWLSTIVFGGAGLAAGAGLALLLVRREL